MAMETLCIRKVILSAFIKKHQLAIYLLIIKCINITIQKAIKL